MLGHSLNCYISYCNFKGTVNLSPVWLAEAFFYCLTQGRPDCVQFPCTVNCNESHYAA